MEQAEKTASHRVHANTLANAKCKSGGIDTQGGLAGRIDNSPVMLAQRQRMNRQFGISRQSFDAHGLVSPARHNLFDGGKVKIPHIPYKPGFREALQPRFTDNRPETVAQRKRQEAANTSQNVSVLTQLKHMAHQWRSSSDMAEQGKPLQPKIRSGIAQRKLQVGRVVYEKGKTGCSYATLKAQINERLKQRQDVAGLYWGAWAQIKAMVFSSDLPDNHKFERGLDQLIDTYAKNDSGVSSDKQKIRDQDKDIKSRLINIDPFNNMMGMVLSGEQDTVFNQFATGFGNSDQGKKTLSEIQSMNPGLRSDTNDFTNTNNPFIALNSLGKDQGKRLDYNFHGVEIDTQGYSSRKDRSENAKNVGKFRWGTVKIGPNIGTYKSEMKSDDPPPENESQTLTAVEMFRGPFCSFITGLKRYLYAKDIFTKEQAMGYNNSFSNMEFKGAVSGASMNKQEYANMRQHQVMANIWVLEYMVQHHPDVKLGTLSHEVPDLGDVSEDVTPVAIYDSLSLLTHMIHAEFDNYKAINAQKNRLRGLLGMGYQEFTGFDQKNMFGQNNNNSSWSDYERFKYHNNTFDPYDKSGEMQVSWDPDESSEDMIIG